MAGKLAETAEQTNYKRGIMKSVPYMRLLTGALATFPLLVAAQAPSPQAAPAPALVEETIELPSLKAKILVRYPVAIEQSWRFDYYIEFTLLSSARPVLCTSDGLTAKAMSGAPEWHGSALDVPVLEVGKRVTARSWFTLDEEISDGKLRHKFQFWDATQWKMTPQGNFSRMDAEYVMIRRPGEKSGQLIGEYPITVRLRPVPVIGGDLRA